MVADLRAALDALRDADGAECFWQTPSGDYRWVLRRRGDRLTVVALWCRSAAIGWQHVLHVDTVLEPFVSEALAALSVGPDA